MAKQKMIAKEGSEMVPADSNPVAADSAPRSKPEAMGKKAKINMILPTGGVLVVGEVPELSEADQSFLDQHHGHSMHHILE